jgi:hypothetical protein
VWVAGAALAGLAVLVRLGAFLARVNLSLDDGAYGVSVVDMREGYRPYRDLFSSQGPLHLPLLYAGDVVGLHAHVAPRLVPLLAGVASTIAAWASARRLGASPRHAFATGALTAVTGSMLWVTGPVSADGPAIAFTFAAVWAALAYRDAPGRARAVATGALLGAGLATKPMIFPVVGPLAWLLWTHRRAGDLARGGSAAVAVWFASALPWGLGRVWDQSIAFHLDKPAEGSPLSRLGKLASTLAGRDLLLLVAVGLGLASAWAVRRKGRALPRRDDLLVVAGWLAAVVVVLVAQNLLLLNHAVMAVPPLVLLFALAPPRAPALALAVAVVVPIQAFQLSDVLVPGDAPAAEASVVADLRRLPAGARAISDIPGLVWHAGLTTPRRLNDNSAARIATGRETTAFVVAGAAERETCAVAIWSFRFAERLDGLRAGLRSVGYEHVRTYGPGRELWLKARCDPGGPAGRGTGAAAPARSPG